MSFFFADADNKAEKDKGKQSLHERLLKSNLEVIHNKRCRMCTLDKEPLAHPKMPASGTTSPVFYILGEAPGETEDKLGRQFVGKAGKLLRHELMRAAFDVFGEEVDSTFLDEYVRWNNTVRCRPPGNRNPSDLETECCRGFIEEDIIGAAPRVIIGTGGVPLRWMLGARATKISMWRGRLLAVRIRGESFWFFPVMHPSYIERVKASKKGEDEYKTFRHDLRRIFRMVRDGLLDEPPSTSTAADVFQNIEYVQGDKSSDLQKVKEWLKEMSKKKAIALDLETHSRPASGTSKYAGTLFRPHAPEARILTVAIGTWNRTVAFPIDHPRAWGSAKKREQVLRLFMRFLHQYRGRVIVQNMSFEVSWIAHFDGSEALGRKRMWEDTKLQAITLDQRAGMHNLDLLCFMYMAVDLKAQSPLDKSNLINEPLDSVLKYNGGDTRFTYRLYRMQRQMLLYEGGRSLMRSYRHRVDTGRTSALMSNKGVWVNKETVEKFDRKLARKVEKIEAAISSTAQAKRFKSKFGHEFDHSSRDDLERMFSVMLRRKEVYKQNAKGARVFTSEEDALCKIPLNIARKIIEHRKTWKLLSTYVRATKDLVFPDERLHANFNVGFAETNRLSCDLPNLQNWPKRSNLWIRNMVEAVAGHVLLASDYGQLEARVIAMISEDESFVQALWDRFDIHRHWAERFFEEFDFLLELKAKEFKTDDEAAILKQFRNQIKNQWVFPLFFGSSLYGVAASLGLEADEAEPLMDEFWDAYPGVKKMQRRQVNFYERHGYVETMLGTRRYGPLSYNQVINTPIQGTAAEIVQDAQIRLTDELIVPNINIHDDLTVEVPAPEYETWAEDIARVMCSCSLDFVTVPLVVEMSVGKKWGEVEEFKEFASDVDFGIK